jgi:predicted transcriptional regulator
MIIGVIKTNENDNEKDPMIFLSELEDRLSIMTSDYFAPDDEIFTPEKYEYIKSYDPNEDANKLNEDASKLNEDANKLSEDANKLNEDTNEINEDANKLNEDL